MSLPTFSADVSLNTYPDKYQEKPYSLIILEQRILPAVDCTGCSWTDQTPGSCTSPDSGLREYTFTLMGINGDWWDACAVFPLKWTDGNLYHPVKCWKNIFHMYGNFELPDSSCHTAKPGPCEQLLHTCRGCCIRALSNDPNCPNGCCHCGQGSDPIWNACQTAYQQCKEKEACNLALIIPDYCLNRNTRCCAGNPAPTPVWPYEHDFGPQWPIQCSQACQQGITCCNQGY